MKAIANRWSRQIDNKQAALERQLLLLRRRKEHTKKQQRAKLKNPICLFWKQIYGSRKPPLETPDKK